MGNINKLVAITAAIGTLLLSGCTNSQPQYSVKPQYIPPPQGQYKPVNLNKQEIVFKGGKPFRIPKLTVPLLVSSSFPSIQMKSIIQQNGLTCNLGDVIWIGRIAAKEFVRLKKHNETSAYAYLGKASQVHETGCAHPLSNQEYNFYREKEKERTETILRLLESSRSNTVEVSGTMNHNVYRY